MNNLSLDNFSRRKAIKILAIGNYVTLGFDIIQGFLFVPLYLTFLGNNLYGLWLGTGGIINALAFLDMGTATLTIQRISTEYGRGNMQGIGLYFITGIAIHLVLMTFLLVGGIVLSFSLRSFFVLDNNEYDLLLKASCGAVCALVITLLNNTIEGTLNALQKPLFGKITQVLGALFGIILTYLMLVWGYSVMSISAGLLVRAVINTLPNVIYLIMIFRKNGISFIRFNLGVVKDYLRLTPSIFLSKIGGALVGNIEPTLITIFVSPQVSVYYSITSKAGMLFRMILDRIGSILLPPLSHLYSNEGLIKLKKILLNFFNIAFPAVIAGYAIFFLLNKFFVNIWVGPQNYLGDVFTLLLAFSLLLGFLSSIMSYLFTILGDIKYPSYYIFLESILKLLGLYLLLKLLGIYGLPIAIILTSIVFVSIYARRWNKKLELTRDERSSLNLSILKNILLVAVLTILGCIILKYFKISTFEGFLLMLMIVSSLFLIVILSGNKLIFHQLKVIAVEKINYIKNKRFKS